VTRIQISTSSDVYTKLVFVTLLYCTPTNFQ